MGMGVISYEYTIPCETWLSFDFFGGVILEKKTNTPYTNSNRIIPYIAAGYYEIR